ncbi:uracil-DNA glycosylase [Candidatus Gracilibacteria bacterium HOT-871]|nr:uracil-DNA glycosylase [Candidatus Gracilibacteria bacterium HOT-871]
MKTIFEKIFEEICNDPENKEFKEKGYEPVYTAGAKVKIVIVGQAPGRKAQETKKPWNDVSGETLRKWLGITDEQFYDPDLISLMPMDFYYPGKGSHGDLPPRKGFAEKWHPILLKNMPEVELFILIGAYSQKYYLAKNIKSNLTETVHSYEEYLPKYFPIVHPSPLNFRWRSKNLWFEDEVIPELQKLVQKIIEENKN